MRNPFFIFKNYIFDPDRKSFIRQIADLITGMSRHKIGVYSYFYSAMHKKSAGPIENYCNFRAINKIGRWQLDSLADSGFTNDKVEFYKTIADKEDLLPHVLGFFQAGNFYSSNALKSPVPASDKKQFLSILEGYLKDRESLFLKLSDSSGGKDVWRIKSNDAGDIVKGLDISASYILEAELEQHQEINKINPNCINTLRIVTVNEPGGIVVAGSFFRLGVDHSHVDNASSGGIFVRYDLQQNVLGREAYRLPWHGGETFLRHPETGFLFEGSRLPYPEKVRELVTRGHQVFPKQKIVGWDIAFTPTGPAIVEANANPATVMNQIAEKGLKTNEVYRRTYAHLV